MNEELREEYLDLEYVPGDSVLASKIYYTDSAAEAVNVMKHSAWPLRIFWDREYEFFLLGSVEYHVHNDMAESARKSGYYGRMSKEKLEDRLWEDGRHGQTAMYYEYAPKDTEKDYELNPFYDGFEAGYWYSALNGMVYVREDSRYLDSPLAKALGKFDEKVTDDAGRSRLTEGYLTDKRIYATESPYETRDMISSREDKEWRIVYSAQDQTYFIGGAKGDDDDFIHSDIINAAMDDGYYLEAGDDFWKASDDSLDLFFSGKEITENAEDAWHWSDGYGSALKYGTGWLFLKDCSPNSFLGLPLGKAFGEPLEIWELDKATGKAEKTPSELTEATRSQLISRSRNAGLYKGDASRGKNRFERKKYSKIASQVKSYNQIDMNQFFKQDILEVNIPVTGETAEYTVTMKLNGVVAEMAKNIKANKGKFEYRTVLQSLTKVLNTTDVYVKCECLDFRYNFAHWAIVNNYSADGTDKDPGAGRGLANPDNDKGIGCKHILLVLNNQDWAMKVASVINNYVNYAEENMMKPFQNVIFPKLYEVHIDGAAEAGLVPEDADLTSEKHIIELINDWAKGRGKIQKGTNWNPVYVKKAAEQEKAAEKEE